MPDVQFNDETSQDLYQFRSRTILGEARTPGMVRWLMRHGLVKTEKGAGVILIIIAIIAFAASAYFFSTIL